MGDKEKYEIWGLSLSLKPPITNIDQKLPICKREAQLFTDERSRKMHKPSTNKTLIMPRINKGVDIKPQLVEITGKLGSPNSTLLSYGGDGNKRKGGSSGEREMISSDDEGGHGGGSGGEHGGCGGGRGESKKLRLSKEQIMVLEQAFREHTTLNTKRKMALAKRVNLKPRQVEVWFQNRRARTKLKQTELDCEYLRRFCKSLTEENKKLQKEVHELRAAIPTKVSPTNLTMCPSCNTMSFSSPATATKTLTGEMVKYHAEIRHPHVPFNLKKLPLTIKKNRTFETHNPCS